MRGAPMLTGKRMATGLITLLMIATLAMPVFAQETTPSDDAVTPVPTTEPTATPDDEPVTTIKPIPGGQLTRKGIFGDVLEVGGSSITIAIKFGNVTVGVDANTTYAASGGSDDPFGLSDIVVGDRAAVHLNQASVAEGDPEPTLAPTPTPTATTTPSDDTITPAPTPTPIFVEPSFREVVARSIHIIPSKSNRKHDRTVVTSTCNSKGKNKMTVLDDEGAEVELDCSGETTEEGSDVILLKKGKVKGKPDEVVGSVNPGDIDTRIDNLKGGASEARKAQLDELRAERDAAKEERLEKLEEKTTGPNKEKVTGARNKGKGGGGSSSGGSGGGTPTPTTTSGNGNSNSGRGNSGSSGGGNSGNSSGGSSAAPTPTPTSTSSGGGNSGGGNSGGGGNPNK